MKKTIFILAVTTVIAGIFIGCQSPDQKVASAQAKVDDANQNLAVAQNNADSAAQKAASAEEWAIFKNEAGAKIKDNQIRIAALKMKIRKSADGVDTVYSSTIDTLEQHNKNMQARIDAYAKSQVAWASFKLQFDTDMGDLVNALKDIGNKVKN